MKLFILLTFCLSSIIGIWPITKLDGTPVSISSPSEFKRWAGINGDETDTQVSAVEKYIMNYKEDFTSFIYVTTLYPGVKFNLEKSVDGAIQGMSRNAYWHNVIVSEKSQVIVCGVRGIRFTIQGQLGDRNAQATSISFQKGNKHYLLNNTFATDNSDNLATCNRIISSIK